MLNLLGDLLSFQIATSSVVDYQHYTDVVYPDQHSVPGEVLLKLSVYSCFCLFWSAKHVINTAYFNYTV